MSEQQMTAISMPCREATQCFNDIYIRFRDVSGYRVGVCLTMNVGLE